MTDKRESDIDTVRGFLMTEWPKEDTWAVQARDAFQRLFPDAGEPTRAPLDKAKALAETTPDLLDMLAQVERWMSGYGTTPKRDMHQKVRAAIAEAKATP